MDSPYVTLLVLAVLYIFGLVIFRAGRNGGVADITGKNARPIVEWLRISDERLKTLKLISDAGFAVWIVLWTVVLGCHAVTILQRIIYHRP